MTLTAPASGPAVNRIPPVTAGDLAVLVSGTPDPTWDVIVATAVSYVEAYCGPIVDTAWTYLERQDAAGCLRLPAPGIATVTTVVTPAGADVTASVTADDVDWKYAIVSPPAWSPGLWRVTVTTHRETGDDELREATLLLAKHLLESRRGGSVRPAAYGGQMGGQPPSFSVPKRVLELMAPHRLVQGMVR